MPYFHVVFTVPRELRELVYANKRLLYDALFSASSQTLLTVARNNLSLSLGFFGVLHTWNQELQYHPHVHYVVAGGGLHTDTHQWEHAPKADRFLLPVRVLGAVFCGKFIERLKELYGTGQLYLPESHLKDPRAFEHLVSQATSKKWVVYAKRPFSGPERVVKYLAGYTHRVGISNSRLCSITDTTVTFLARDKHDPSKRRRVTLSHETFTRRFLQHALPKSYRRIRYFGFLAVHRKREALTLIRSTLTAPVAVPETTPSLGTCCPNCHAPEFRKPHSRHLLTPGFVPLRAREPPCGLSP